jgi:hypothetical protein
MIINPITKTITLGAMLVLFVTTSPSTPAQSTHQHTVVGSRIEGKDHPEQIPDQAAYGLFLTAISSPTEDGKASRAVHLGMMRLSDPDSQAVLPILSSFRAQRKKLIDDYNAIATEANQRGTEPDPDVRATFFRNLNSLVIATHDTLKSTLSSQGWGNFDKYVQRQKSGMSLPAEVAQ